MHSERWTFSPFGRFKVNSLGRLPLCFTEPIARDCNDVIVLVLEESLVFPVDDVVRV